jgi:hypothetical protein
LRISSIAKKFNPKSALPLHFVLNHTAPLDFARLQKPNIISHFGGRGRQIVGVPAQNQRTPIIHQTPSTTTTTHDPNCFFFTRTLALLPPPDPAAGEHGVTLLPPIAPAIRRAHAQPLPVNIACPSRVTQPSNLSTLKPRNPTSNI